MYCFRHKDIWTIFVGSSNLTQNALTINNELNIKFSSYMDGLIVEQMLSQFSELFERSFFIKDIIDQYSANYVNNKITNNLKITPNQMQKIALKNLEQARLDKLKKGLLIRQQELVKHM